MKKQHHRKLSGWYGRNPTATFVRDPAGSYCAINANSVNRIACRSPKLLAELLELASIPLPATKLTKWVKSAPDEASSIVEQLIKCKCLISDTKENIERLMGVSSRPPLRPLGSVVFCVTGTIGAAYMVGRIVGLLPFATQVDVVLTENAARFLSKVALQSHGVRVWTAVFESQGDVRLPHIELAETADLVVVCPASAHTLASLARADCSDLTSLLVTATRAPVVVVPSMNQTMWKNLAVQRNVQQLAADGLWIVEPRRAFEVATLGRGDRTTFGADGLLPANSAATLAFIRQVAAKKARRSDDEPDRLG